MDESQIVATSLELLGKAWGVPIELASDGGCTLEFEEHLTASVRHDAENSRLHVDTEIRDIHANHRDDIYRLALALGFDAFAESGVALAIDPRTNELIARSRIALFGLEPDEVAEQIAESLLVSRALQERLQAGHHHDDGANQSSLPSMTEQHIIKA